MLDYAVSKRLGSSFVLNVIMTTSPPVKPSASIVSMILLSIFFRHVCARRVRFYRLYSPCPKCEY